MDLEKIIRESIQKVFIDYIVDIVIEKLNNYNKKALVIFTGSTLGLEQSLKNIMKLKEDKWDIDIIFSKSASEILNVELIKELLNIDKIYTDENITKTYELVDNNNLILVTQLSVNTSSKIVNCINDNMATNSISYALSKGKNVVASIDGCCPDNEQRNKLNLNNFSIYQKEKLRENLEILKKYNIILSKSENIISEINKIASSNFNNQTKDSISKKNEIYINKKIINRIDIYNNKEFKVIKINKNSVITDLANEEATSLKIKIVKI